MANIKITLVKSINKAPASNSKCLYDIQPI